MPLTVPQRTVADTGSFPVDPVGVAEWLNGLQNLRSVADARQVYRGLKHSNRLHNDIDRRRAILACFIPALRELHQHLSELTHAQPLPLTREFADSAKLRDSLLREEVFAFKLLLNDSDKPLADDARRAMRALARQAESMIHHYRDLPRGILLDAHQLYQLAETHGFVDDKPDQSEATQSAYDLKGNPGTKITESLADHYRYILLIFLADLQQQGVRQLPLLLTFLRECAGKLHIRPSAEGATDPLSFVVDLAHASWPEPARNLLPIDTDSRRSFSLAPAVEHIEKCIAELTANHTGLLGSDTLERQSLQRLHQAFKRSRQRRIARTISYDASSTSFGHKEIANALMLAASADENPDNKPQASGWVIMNRSAQGCLITHPECRAGLVQVGDIVSISEALEPGTEHESVPSEPTDALTKTKVGVVRWMRSRGDKGLDAGIEFLARKVLAVDVTRLNTENNAAEKAMIIACKVEQQVMQTILLPAFLFQVGDQLMASQGDKRRQFLLKRRLQSNGLFSHFTLGDT